MYHTCLVGLSMDKTFFLIIKSSTKVFDSLTLNRRKKVRRLMFDFWNPRLDALNLKLMTVKT